MTIDNSNLNHIDSLQNRIGSSWHICDAEEGVVKQLEYRCLKYTYTLYICRPELDVSNVLLSREWCVDAGEGGPEFDRETVREWDGTTDEEGIVSLCKEVERMAGQLNKLDYPGCLSQDRCTGIDPDMKFEYEDNDIPF